MRATLCAVVCALVFGCGPAPRATENATDQPTEPPAPPERTTKPTRPVVSKKGAKDGPKTKDEPLAFDGLSNTVSNDYFNDPGRADAKYKDKRVRLRGRIDQIGQRDGSVFLGYCTALEAGKVTEPTVVFHFTKEAEKIALDVKKGQIAVVEGTCRGRINDGIARPMGYTFHVRIESCRLITPDEEGKR